MRHRIAIAGVLIVVAAAHCVAGQTQNAADLYRQALKAAPADQQTVQRLRKWDELPLEEARTLAAAHVEPIKLISQAAALKQVDWQLDERRPDLSFIRPLRTLSEIATLQAHIRAADGQAPEAVDGLADLALMGRRVQQIPFMVARISGDAVEILSLQEAAQYIPALDATRVRALTQRLDQLPQAPSIEELTAAEQKTAVVQAAPAQQAQAQLQRVTQAVVEQDKDAQATRAMFRAALAHRTGGDQAMEKVKDPFGNGPFSVRKWDGGYELASKLEVRGEKVVLAVGKPEPDAE